MLNGKIYPILRTLIGCLMLACLLNPNTGFGATTGEVKERKDIDKKYLWNLKDIYPTDDAWKADMDAIEKMIPKIAGYQGKISKSGADLLAYFKDSEEAGKKFENCQVYAGMMCDQDTRDQTYVGFRDRVQTLGAKFGEALSWFSPELVSIPNETFEKWYKEVPGLSLYKHSIDTQLRQREHTLSPAEEKILSLSSTLAASPSNASGALRNTDIKFPTIKDENGQDVQLSEGRYAAMLESPSQDIRRTTAMNMLSTYGQYKNTAAALMTGNCAKDIFYAKSRNYATSLQASLDNDNIDTTVYLNLIASVHKNLDALHKYVTLRKEALGLKEIHLYDFQCAMLPETKIEVPYEQAVSTIKTAMTPLGKDYNDAMSKGFAGGWIDVYETKNKRSGAYSWGSYLSHPYMLLNYNNTLDDMFTVAHEMGHSMHTYHSKKQPYTYADYSLFVAEVASTFNEALLMDHLLKNEKDAKKKLYLLNQYIDNIRGTLITQVIFAEFELKMHTALENGEPLTAESLGQMYLDVIKSYYGPEVTYDDEYAYTWIRIPHFYRNFYVYKYATSYAASQALSQSVLQKDPKKHKEALDKYINFISSGSSKYPLELLKDAGVDMSTSKPIDDTMKLFSSLVDQMDKLLKETKGAKK
jgi:oligoendopeptidase F